MFVIILVLMIFVFMGHKVYKNRQKKKNIEKLEKSLIDLQLTIQDAVYCCKHSIPPAA